MSRKNRFIVPTKPSNGKLSNDNITVIILSSKTNDRMRSYGAKPLIKLPNGQTVLQQQVNTISQYLPEAEIVLVVGYNFEKVIKNCPKWIRIVENANYDQHNTVEELRLGINNSTTDRLLIIDGDTIFSNKTVLNLPKDKTSIVIDKESMIDPSEVGVTFHEKIATNFFYGLDYKYCNILSIMGKELKTLSNYCSNLNNRNKFVFEGLNHVIEKGGKIQVVHNTDKILHKIESSKYLRKMYENPDIQ